MILHILTDSPYTIKFIGFTNQYFNKNDHQYIVALRKTRAFDNYYTDIDNCYIVYSFTDIIKLASKFVKARKVIFHQLNQPKLLLLLLLFYPAAFRKGVWSIWGADAYYHLYKTNSIKDRLIYKVFAISIKRFDTIVSMIPGDYELVKKRYNSMAKYFHAYYPSSIDLSSIDIIVKQTKAEQAQTIIMVGNSGDPSNKHADSFELLLRYRYHNIAVVSVLSYGGNDQYIKSVIKLGRELFGKKFIPVTEFMSFDDYLSFLSKVDICIFSHKRQQGLGNLFLFLALGKKLYISKQITTYNHFTSIGIKIFSTEDIESMSFESFCSMDLNLSQDNSKIIKSELSFDRIKRQWKRVYGQRCDVR